MEETTQTTPPPKVESPNSSQTPEGNLQGVLAYIPFLFIIAALQKLEDDTLMFHAKNGAGLTLLFIVASFVSAWLHVLFGSLLMLVFLVPAIIGAFHGWKNEKWMIPGISSWAQNIPLDKWFHESHEKNMNEDIPKTEPTPESPAPAATPEVNQTVVSETTENVATAENLEAPSGVPTAPVEVPKTPETEEVLKPEFKPELPEIKIEPTQDPNSNNTNSNL